MSADGRQIERESMNGEGNRAHTPDMRRLGNDRLLQLHAGLHDTSACPRTSVMSESRLRTMHEHGREPSEPRETAAAPGA